MQNHIIKSQLIDIRLSGSIDARSFQNEISRVYNTKAISILEKVFDEVCPEDYVLKIDRLILDFGKLSFSSFEGDFETRLRETVREVMPAKMFKAKLNSNQQVYLDNEKTEKLILYDSSFLEALGYFLEKGIMPWWVAKLSNREIEWEFLKLIYSSKHKLISFIRAKIHSVNFRRRLIYQFSDELISKLTVLPLLITHMEILQTYSIFINSLIGSPEVTEREEMRRQVWESFIIAVYDTKSPVVDYSDLIKKILYAGKNIFHKINKNKLLRELAHHKPGIQRKTHKDILKDIGDNEDNYDSNVIDSIGFNNIEIKKTKQYRNKKIEQYLKKIEDESIETESLSEDYIQNAGLVLLTPFIPAFFGNLKLLKDNKFKDEISIQRAVHLLQYLAVSSEETPEHFLTLNKILCGLQPEHPLHKGIKVMPEEKEESDKLLKSAIEHWGELKNTSPEGLRNTFLKRGGILHRKDSAWYLRVERKGFDILIDRLPWSISAIKLPWMNDILNVEW